MGVWRGGEGGVGCARSAVEGVEQPAVAGVGGGVGEAEAVGRAGGRWARRGFDDSK